MRLERFISVVVLGVVTGCSGASNDIVAPPPEQFVAPSSAPTAVASATASAEPTASAPPPTAVEPSLPPGMAVFELGSAGPSWKGWVVTAPKEARVLGDGAEDARVAIDGIGALDLVFSQKPTPLAARKANLKASASSASGLTVKQTVIADVPEKLAWSTTRTSKGATATQFYFFMNLEVAGVTVSCGTSFDGANSKEQLTAYEQVCATLRKK